MKIPRFTVRRAMLLIALIAMGCFVASEFREGLPPQFVIRGIPDRFARLKPGMSWQEAHDILGLETSWWRGGTDARYFGGGLVGSSLQEGYTVGRTRLSLIRVAFRAEPGPVGKDYHGDKATRLTRASFSFKGETIVKMPSR